jgi:hypothetical protein
MNDPSNQWLDEGLARGTALIRRLEEQYGAEVLGYDVDERGEIVVDLRLNGRHPAVRALRVADTAARSAARLEAARLRRTFGHRVLTHAQTVREFLRELQRERPSAADRDPRRTDADRPA